MDQDYGKSVMVALLPTTSYWCHQDLPHLTLIYAGQIPDLDEGTHDELIRAAIDIVKSSASITLEVTGKDELGGSERVDVLLLRPTPVLLQMRRRVESFNASEYPFKPHVTVGKVGSYDDAGDGIPTCITFDRVLVGWGVDRSVYRLL